VNICQSYKQEPGCLVQFLRLLVERCPGAQSATGNTCHHRPRGGPGQKGLKIFEDRTCTSEDDRGQTNTQTDTLITTGPILRNDKIESQESTKYLLTQGNGYAQKDRPTQDTHFNYRQKLALN